MSNETETKLLYDIATGRDDDELVSVVTAMIDDGYEPIGGVAVAVDRSLLGTDIARGEAVRHTWAQAMVKR